MHIKRLAAVLFVFVLVNGLSARNHHKKHSPKNLNEAIIQLDKVYTVKNKKEIYDMTESEYITKSQFSTGLWIRYNWGLSQGTKLSMYFNDLGIYHPNDMTAIIVHSYYRHLHNQDFDLDKQIKYYQNRRIKSQKIKDQNKNQ